MKKNIFFLYLLIICAGCVSLPEKAPFTTLPQDSTNAVSYHLVLQQKEPIIIQPDVQLHSGGGLFDMAFDSAASGFVNGLTKGQAERQIKGLYGKGLGKEFRDVFTNAFTQLAKSNSTFGLASIDFPQKDNLITAKEVKNSSVFKITIIHGLSIDCSIFGVSADVVFFRHGQNRSAFNSKLFYFSDRIHPEKNKDTILPWKADDAQLYRQETKESIAEVISMLKYGFFDAQGTPPPSQPEMKITFLDGLTMAKDVSHGYILKHDQQRIIFRDKVSGFLISTIPESIEPVVINN